MVIHISQDREILGQVCGLENVPLCLFVASCSSKDAYKKYDAEGYNVTVKYDANGSYFGNAGQLYVTDTYNIKYNVWVQI